ncbi:uncharacterized protein TNCT_475571 [Trichonephila clavata]|uniref:Uncharacterized protein n=1 Tax=Trichonephila clavata TaxID=2740835 RepID=A0A8X6HIG9_TRICU|nr:uncharacterized protein TNCT_475571 [Trichonephila clavata]
MVGHYSQGLHCDIPSHFSENGYFDVSALPNTVYFHLTRHSPADFTALAALLPAITEPSVVLHTHHACRSSTRLIYICDPYIYKEKNSCHDLCLNPHIYYLNDERSRTA